MATLPEIWNPEKTWVFAVGILKWANSDAYESFPDAVPNRADKRWLDILRAKGVPAKQICYLQDQKATLENIQAKLPQFLASAAKDHLFIFYFAGHGDWDWETGEHYFINYDANADDHDYSWSVTSIFKAIKTSFRGAGVLLLADCCYSGGLIDAIHQQAPKTAMACISSAYSRNSSTGQWTFTESLCRGWSGDASVDLDGDGEISLYDLARYIELEMAFVEEQKSMFLTTGNFDPQILLVKTAKRTAVDIPQRVEAKWEGQWYKAKTCSREGTKVWVNYVEDGTEEWVAERDIRPYQPHGFAAGAQVKVAYYSKWYSATVKKAWYGLHFIRYEDYGEDWDEWVSHDRIRA